MFILNRIHQSKYILPHIANFVKTFRKLLFKAEIKKSYPQFMIKLRITFAQNRTGAEKRHNVSGFERNKI